MRRVEIPVLVEHLKSIGKSENATITDDALHLIARSSEGSVRDGLSILDQAIAMGSGKVDGDTVRAMLGLADRSRIYDLLEQVLGGQVKQSLDGVTGLYMDGAEPTQILSDLADAVHAATRIKTAGADAAPDSLTTDDRSRMTELAEKLSVPALSRAWSMILKGMGEISDAPDPRVAIEMLLIRMAHMADLPAPDELIRRFNADPANSTKPAADTKQPNGNGAHTSASKSGQPTRSQENAGPGVVEDDAPPFGDQGWGQGEGQGEGAAPAQIDAEPTTPTSLGNFEDLVELIARKRDVKLLSDVEKNIRLVSFEEGRIEVNLIDTAPKNLVGKLSQKLTGWTGKRWVIVVSGENGAPTLAELRDAEFEKNSAEVKAHPAVTAAEAQFPGLKITRIRKIDQAATAATKTGNLDAKSKRSGTSHKK